MGICNRHFGSNKKAITLRVETMVKDGTFPLLREFHEALSIAANSLLRSLAYLTSRSAIVVVTPLYPKVGVDLVHLAREKKDWYDTRRPSVTLRVPQVNELCTLYKERKGPVNLDRVPGQKTKRRNRIQV